MAGSIVEGSIVQLKSGGPKMTVKWLEDGDAYCEWFAGAEIKGARFALVQLDLIS